MKMFKLGVTGGIGSGKSTVTKILVENYNAYEFEADIVAKKIVAENEQLKEEFKQTFGSRFFDELGNLKRREFAEFVFSDKERTRKLNSLVHPKVKEAATEHFQKAKDEGRSFFVHNAPLIFEAGIEKQLDAVLVVAVSEENALKRTIERDKTTENEVKLRMSKQMPLAEKIAKADFVIWNDGGFEKLKTAVENFYEKHLKDKL